MRDKVLARVCIPSHVGGMEGIKTHDKPSPAHWDDGGKQSWDLQLLQLQDPLQMQYSRTQVQHGL